MTKIFVRSYTCMCFEMGLPYYEKGIGFSTCDGNVNGRVTDINSHHLFENLSYVNARNDTLVLRNNIISPFSEIKFS
jgi:hypothetical protein